MKILLAENEKKYFRRDQFISESRKDYKDWEVCGRLSDCEELVGVNRRR